MAIIIAPFVPMLFEYDFGEFVTWEKDLFSTKESIDLLPLVAALSLSPLTSGILTILFEIILFAFTHKKRLLNAIEMVPVLEKEIEEITYTAQRLQNQ